MLRCCTFPCTSTHTSCYAAARSLALPHIRHATLLHVLLHFHTYVMLRCCTYRSLALPHIRHATLLHVSCTSTHTSCYAAARSLALPHIRHATLLHVLLHFHTYVICYAAARSLALPHIRVRHATSQNSLLCWWLQSLERSLQTTSATKTPQMAKLCPQPRWVCEALGRKPTKKSSSLAGTLVKNTTPRQLNTYKDCRQDFKNMGSTCMLQSGSRASKAMSWTTSDNFVLERKKGTFRRNPRRTKLLFRACKTLDFPLLKWPFQGICTRNLFHKYKTV